MKKRGMLVALAGTIVLVSTVLLLAGKTATPPADETLWPTRGWATASPASVGLDEEVLLRLDKDFATGKFLLMDSFVVFRCGKKVYERTYSHDYVNIYGKEAKEKGPLNQRQTGPYNYFDPDWHPYYHGTDMHSMQSVTKTVTSVIIGAAKTRGDFKAGLDTPVLKYFDVSKVKNVDERKRRMTLHDLVTMTSGLDWDEDVPDNDPRNDMSRMEGTDDWVQYTIDRPMAAEPGKVGNYNSGATELLAYIFQKETGQDIDEYGEKYLFAPLGIKHYWKRTYLGVVDTEGGLFLSGSDLAKIGYLYLHDGIWGGTQIVSKEWIKESLKSSLDVDSDFDYGFLWWLLKRADSSGYVWIARGFGAQHLMVFPKENLIAVFTGWRILGKEADDYEADEKEFARRILTAVKSKSCGDTASSNPR
jgi:CubicO group peptidase (beta-lactamase class C family)